MSHEIYQSLREVFVLLEFCIHDTLAPFLLENIEFETLLLIQQQKNWRLVDLRQRLLCDKSKITRIIDHLEERGFVQRQHDPADRRAWRVSITENGLQLQQQAEFAVQDILGQCFNTLAPGDKEQLHAKLKSLRLHLMTLRNEG